ncbi:MAG: hypothetical protein EON86_16015 [Brevundimonas sp.]|nr:MAG: hypothetical protein EON86_16015 [Brevundimonas sp.]
MKTPNRWLARSLAASLLVLISSCASVDHPEPQTVVGRISRLLPQAASESKLGAQWTYSAYEIRPTDRPESPVYIIIADRDGVCPYNDQDPRENEANQIYRIEYVRSGREIELLFPSYSDFISTRCEKISDPA